MDSVDITLGIRCSQNAASRPGCYTCASASTARSRGGQRQKRFLCRRGPGLCHVSHAFHAARHVRFSLGSRSKLRSTPDAFARVAWPEIEATQRSAATMNAGHKTIATSGAVGYAVTLRLLSQVPGFSASAPVLPMLSGPMPNFSVNRRSNGRPLQGKRVLSLRGRPLNPGYLER